MGPKGSRTRAAPSRFSPCLTAADSLHKISPLKSFGLHPLKGARKGRWALTVNGPWRVCFRFKSGDAYDVEVTDYHKG